MRRDTNKAGKEEGGGGREVEEEEESVEHATSGGVGFRSREDGGRVSIPAIMPGPHAHMG